MKKLNETMYNKLVLQAEEARDQGLVKLADAIMDAIGPEPANEKVEYSYADLQEDIHKSVWKLAKHLMVYYDVKSADAGKIDPIIVSWAARLVNELEHGLEITASVGPLEPKVPGETK